MTEVAAAEDSGLPLTGERTIPGLAEENYWFRRHEAVYQALLPRCTDATVLEAGCGEGYGAALLTTVARRVLALELDRTVVGHASRRYPEVGVAVANLVDLPVPDGAVDVVVSLQVLEHLWDQHRFLTECRRVLRPGGALLLSTPNRITFSPGRDTPLNPFHTRELDPDELTGVLRDAGFTEITLLGLHHGPPLTELDARHGGSLVDAQVAAALGGDWSDELRADVAAVRCADFIVAADQPVTPLQGALDLVATAVR